MKKQLIDKQEKLIKRSSNPAKKDDSRKPAPPPQLRRRDGEVSSRFMSSVVSVSSCLDKQEKLIKRSSNPAKMDDSCKPAPPPQRRPRFKEVSSRFMSPVVSVSSCLDKLPKHKHSLRSGSEQRSRIQQKGAELPGSSISAQDSHDDKCKETPLFPTKLPNGLRKPSANLPSPAKRVSASVNHVTNGKNVSKLLIGAARGAPLETLPASSRYLRDRTGDRGISENSTKMSAAPRNMSMSSGSSNGCSLPPRPHAAEIAVGAKVRKTNADQESIHSLKLLHNRYLQLRFCNAKAEATMRAQTQTAERMIYSVSQMISEKRQSVMRKRMEVEFLKRSKTPCSIVDAQMPDLDNWNTLEEEFVTSLSETTDALKNASNQLPISGNIKVDMKELGGALSSALNVLENIESHVSGFLPKAAEMDKLLSQLARVNVVEKNYIEESGYLLSKTHMLQVKECSSVAQLIQLQQRRLG